MCTFSRSLKGWSLVKIFKNRNIDVKQPPCTGPGPCEENYGPTRAGVVFPHLPWGGGVIQGRISVSQTLCEIFCTICSVFLRICTGIP